MRCAVNLREHGHRVSFGRTICISNWDCHGASNLYSYTVKTSGIPGPNIPVTTVVSAETTFEIG